MSQGDGATNRVQSLTRDANLLDSIFSLRSKGFVHLVDINILHVQVSLFQHFWNREGWTDSHDIW